MSLDEFFNWLGALPLVGVLRDLAGERKDWSGESSEDLLGYNVKVGKSIYFIGWDRFGIS